MQNRWSAADAPTDLLDLRVYASRLLGAERSLVLWGGGNTSVKLRERDFRGEEADVLRVKGSGSDLATIERKHFAGIRVEDVRRLAAVESLSDEAMVDYLTHALMSPGDPRPSVEALLHGFLPHRWIDHTHADAIVVVTNQPDPAASVRRVLGDSVIVLPWVRPGFDLARAVMQARESRRTAAGVVLVNHGLLTYADEAEQSYSRTIELVTRAEEFIADTRHGAPRFAGSSLVTTESRRATAVAAAAIRSTVPFAAILEHDGSETMRAFAANARLTAASQRGPATPDHALRVKGWPCVVPATALDDEAALAEAVRTSIAAYVTDYEAYVARHGGAETPRLDAFPRLVFVPGVGAFAIGRTVRDARIALDIARQAIEVVADAEALGEYRPVDERGLFNVEYWPLELYKLTLAPPPKPLAGRVALVTGAASGIGRGIAERLGREGAVVIVTDVDEAGARAVADSIVAAHGSRAACALTLDVADEAAVTTAFERTVAEYGGIDLLVSNAGIAVVAKVADLTLRDWERSLDVNLTGHFLVAREAVRWMRAQRNSTADRGASIVFVSSKNAFAPGAEFAAYSAAKAAETQLAKVLAMEHGADGVRVNIVNPDAVFAGSNLWAPEVRASRASAHGVAEDDLEAFYAKRNLLGTRILPEDVANAVMFLASDAASTITGCTITVDGGVAAAFPR